jgi:hypothetical protein
MIAEALLVWLVSGDADPCLPNVLSAEAGPEKVWPRNRNLVHNLVSANYLALGAVTLPTGLDRHGMAVGLQFIAKGGDDERVVPIACAAERVLGTPRNSRCAADVQGLALTHDRFRPILPSRARELGSALERNALPTSYSTSR